MNDLTGAHLENILLPVDFETHNMGLQNRFAFRHGLWLASGLTATPSPALASAKAPACTFFF